jgi:putative ABC transport system ATP-binding protein/lipoprotein-releasing system ATP-binding protein
MPDTLVKLSDVTRSFETRGGPIAAVANLSCVVSRGDRIAVMGPSGSGKSTLMALMADLDSPSSGTVTWPALPQCESLRPAFIGLAFQTPSLIPALTALENVEVPLLIMGKVGRPRKRAFEVLEFLDLGHLADRLPEELSGGQAQRIALARAMVSEPRLILADEPTGQLDQATGHYVISKLLDWTLRTQAALVVATHDQAVARQMQQTWHMYYGKLEIARSLRAVS